MQHLVVIIYLCKFFPSVK